MNRLTKTITALEDNIDIQTVIDKLYEYEDAEESGQLLRLPEYAYYIKNNKVYRGKVLDIKYQAVDHAVWYSIKDFDDRKEEASIFRGRLNIEVFNTRTEADRACR